jgi:hypothetical protein
MMYRLLGHERVALSRNQIETMVRDALLSLDTKVTCDGEGFATAISARPEFRHLVEGRPIPGALTQVSPK